ncbi:MAG: hypothetical protein ABEJ76_08830 [Halanaeroarchaeum sp.]
MTRFDAATADGRVGLVADAIAAHRERDSHHCTVVTGGGIPDEPAPWVQFAGRDSVLNVDVTDAEYDRLERVLEEVRGLTVAERSSPDDADGTNVRLAVQVDDDRVAQVVERLFREVFDRPADYRLWATQI